jgi:hypothetical protein
MVLHFKKMKKNIFALTFLLVVAGCSTTQPSGLVDENILVKLPIPGSGWTIRSGEKGDKSIRLWEKENERFVITIDRNRFRSEPEKLKTGMDDAARENLTTDFQSTELKQGLVNNYPMVLWQTKATLKSGTKTFNLLLYIKGNDATYLVQRRWNNQQVSDADRQRWIDYLESISVCDNRYPEHQSPKLEEQWPGLYYNPAGLTNGVKK